MVEKLSRMRIREIYRIVFVTGFIGMFLVSSSSTLHAVAIKKKSKVKRMVSHNGSPMPNPSIRARGERIITVLRRKLFLAKR
jgi:hypothetical protein